MANTIQILVKAKDDASRTLGQVGNRAERLGNKLRDMRGPLLAATAAIGGLGLLAGKPFATTSDTPAKESSTLVSLSSPTATPLPDFPDSMSFTILVT